jgi:hypothetical protein
VSLILPLLHPQESPSQHHKSGKVNLSNSPFHVLSFVFSINCPNLLLIGMIKTARRKNFLSSKRLNEFHNKNLSLTKFCFFVNKGVAFVCNYRSYNYPLKQKQMLCVNLPRGCVIFCNSEQGNTSCTHLYEV